MLRRYSEMEDVKLIASRMFDLKSMMSFLFKKSR